MIKNHAALRINAKTIGILQPSYIPWIGYFEQIARADVFVFYDDVPFDKHGWRNRNRIKTDQGVRWLTVPVHASMACAEQRLNSISICADAAKWKKKHRATLEQSYKKSLWFSQYAPDFFAILDQPWSFLSDLTIAILEWMCQSFDIRTPLVRSSQLGVHGGKNERLINIVTALGGTCFYEGAAGKNYIDRKLFAAHGIDLMFQAYLPREYPQLHGTFAPYLSALDLLFNCGPQAKDFIAGELSGI